MADRELRRMSRTELVEIIFALKQSEDRLKEENAALTAQLQDRQIHIQNAGSIAQAALELNQVFEAAQAAADDYLASVRAVNDNADHAAETIRAGARSEAQQILAQAQAEAETLKEQAKLECQRMMETAEHKREQTEAECRALREKTAQEVQARRDEFERHAAELLGRHCDTDILPEDK